MFAGVARARRRLPDLQHVRGHRRAALARVRAAAHARRLAPAGARSVLVETLVDRLARLGHRHPRRPAARAGAARRCWRRSASTCGTTGHRDRAAARSSSACVVGMIATLVSGFVPGAPRDAGRAGRGDARRRHARAPGASAHAPARRLARGRSALGLVALLFGLFGGAERRRPRPSLLGLGAVLMIFGVALLAPLLVRPLARVHRRAAGSASRACPAGSRARTPSASRSAPRSPPSALMIGLALVVFVGDLRRRPARLDRQGDRRAVQPPALIVTHDDGFSPMPGGVAEQLRRGRRASTSSRRCASTRPTSRAAATTCRSPASTRRRSTRCSSPSWAEGDRRDARPTCSDDQVARSTTTGRRATTSRSATSVQVTTPTRQDGRPTSSSGTYDNQVGLLGDIIVTNAVDDARLEPSPTSRSILVGGTGTDPNTLDAGGDAAR